MAKIFQKNIKTLSKKDSFLYETLFHNANGYIGVRGCLEEGVPADFNTMRGTYINGFYDIVDMKQAENLCNFIEKKDTMLNIADTQTIYLFVNGEPFDMLKGNILKYKRTLDMDAGITQRDIEWKSPKGDKIGINIKRMTSFEELSLFTIEYKVTALSGNVSLLFSSKHIPEVMNYSDPTDPRLAAESPKFISTIEAGINDGVSYALCETSRSKLKCCSVVSHEISDAKSRLCTVKDEDGNLTCDVVSDLKKGESVTLVKYSIFTDSLRCEDPLSSAKEKMAKVLDNGLKYYYKKQAAYLEEFWAGSMLEIHNDPKMNEAVNFNMYELLCSSAKDSYGNIAAKGLSGEGYEGHYFWDSEMFVIPFFVLTDPYLAKMLISYRYRTLEKAKENAKLLGHKKGALFPWRTITGVECSGYFPSGTAQYHIVGDIAYAIVNYYLTTGDLDFIKKYGEEILIETARLWLDVGNYVGGTFRINDVSGPDEYTCMVNNNYYTNRVAKYNLSWAVKFYELLKERGIEKELKKKVQITAAEIKEMSEAADKMYFPKISKDGVIPQDDSFFDKPVWNIKATPKSDFPLLLHYHPLHLYRYQVCKQADTVMAFFLFPDAVEKNTQKKSFEYYEKITTHDSSLSKCAFSIVASKLGMQDKAYKYFGNSAEFDIRDLHDNTSYGIHTANMGGSFMAVVYGFAGLSINEKGISIAPFVPYKWSGYSFKIRFMGSRIRTDVTKEEVSVVLEEGEAFAMKIYGKKTKITKKKTVVKV
ncbi:glycoside hydrolase family 65 protein [Butyrivibrio sp. INlla21]|uniref:glycoside hydrolase family 65 protein n=1 Tax=Butyrivibrio sp. INlla21 TaxID=1520811 RepID=UPI0008E98F63|nr:glycosyl hydrolase family 65 protein [Butyrivibrio sp. INlla21]SFV00076.1 alpha,alpha-trehalose phosphorylase [Butyrivibrio sp. INlla21]